MARAFDSTAYALADELSPTTQLIVKRTGVPEIERTNLSVLAESIVPLLKDLGIADTTYVDEADVQATQKINTILSTVGGNTASITNILNTYASTTYVAAQASQTLNAAFEASTAHASTVLLAYATKSEALAIKSDAISAAVAGATTEITSRLTSYATQTFVTSQAQLTLNSAFSQASAYIDQTLTTYVTEDEARTIARDEAEAKVEDATASWNLTLEAYVTTEGMALIQNNILNAANDATRGYLDASNFVIVNDLNNVKAKWGVNINANNQVIGVARLDASTVGTAIESTFTFSVDAFRFSHVAAATQYFRSTTRASKSWSGKVFGASTGFSNLNHAQPPLSFYGPSSLLAPSHPSEVIAIREGTAMIMLTGRITNLNQNMTIYYKIRDSGPYIALSSVSVGDGVPVTIVRGADFFYGLPTSAILDFFIAPCNALGEITGGTEAATDALSMELDALSFNI
jgi:hypothetical protein